MLHTQPVIDLPCPPSVETRSKTISPGIYFDLPMADYHADPSLGSTDLKAVLVHPAVYWQRSALNPNRAADKGTQAMKIGRALHTLVLEGEAVFARTFIQEPQSADFPDALVSADDLRNYCKRRVLKGVGTTKAEMAKAIKKDDPSIQIWDDIRALFDVMVLRDGMEVLKPDDMAEVRAAADNIMANPHFAKAFKGGAPEISVFWVDENGIPCKCRYDYLKPRTIVNLKKFQNRRQRPVDIAVHLALAEFRYDLQAVHYLSGFPYLVEHARAGRMFGKCPLPEGWVRQLCAPEAITYSWIFHQLDGGPPVTVGRQVTAQSPALNRATREIAHAKTLYRDCLAKYGSQRWVSDEPIIELTEANLPAWMREEVEVL